MRAPLGCVEVVELVTGYLDGALDKRTAKRVRAHLAQCDGCAEYVEQIRMATTVAATALDEQLDTEVRDRLLSAFRDFHRKA